MINKVILIGNLGKDPELRSFESGSSVCTFTLATSETYKDKQGNKQQSTEWHNISIWGKIAEVASKYLRKGSKVYLEGNIKTRSWGNDKGEKRYTTEILVNNMTMLDGKPAEEAKPIQQDIDTSGFPQDDDLPI